MMCITSLLLMIIQIVMAFGLSSYFEQLELLVKSKYLYSAYMQDTVKSDDYIVYDAEIIFMLHKDSNKSLNVNVVMQNNDSTYSSLISWKSEKLSSNEVAISKNIAQKNGLKIGDNVYSKNLVNGNVQGYSIKEILPAVNNTRVENDNFKSGLIIMGFDSIYSETLKHKYLVYTNESVNNMSLNSFNVPNDILYRDDEIKDIILHMAPYVVIYVILILSIIMVYILYLHRLIIHNTKRLIIIGCQKKELDKSLGRYYFRCGIILLFVNLVYMVLQIMCGIVSVEISFSILVFFIELIFFVAVQSFLRCRLWRK